VRLDIRCRTSFGPWLPTSPLLFFFTYQTATLITPKPRAHILKTLIAFAMLTAALIVPASAKDRPIKFCSFLDPALPSCAKVKENDPHVEWRQTPDDAGAGPGKRCIGVPNFNDHRESDNTSTLGPECFFITDSKVAKAIFKACQVEKCVVKGTIDRWGFIVKVEHAGKAYSCEHDGCNFQDPNNIPATKN
jgi:hypothetical protein